MRILRLISILILLTASPGWATTYYVKNGGNNASAGTSHATAWEDTTNLYSLLPGDEVYFQCGDSWSGEQINIGWNNATVGAYYWDDPEHLTGTDLPAGHVKPIIEGTLCTGVADNSTSDGFPNDVYAALVETSGVNSTTIQDLRILNSGGSGIITQSATSNIYRIDMDNTCGSGIMVYYATAGTIEGNDLEGVAMAYRSCLYPEIDDLAGGVTKGGPADYVFPMSANLLVKGNSVKNSCGEGFQTPVWANNITFEDNYIQDVRLGFNIYANAGITTHHITIKNNIVLGSTDHTYHTAGGTYMGGGVYFNDLNRNSVHDIYIYNNLFSGNLGAGVKIAPGDGDMYNILIYANTIAGTQDGIRIDSAATFTGTNEIKNNIFTDIVDLPYDGSTEANLDWDYNHWDSTPAAEAQGANDQTGDPELAASVWTDTQGMDVSDFVPAQGSSAVNNGVAVSGYNYRIAPTSSIPDSVSNVTSYTGAGWDMGAIEYTGVDVTVISNGSPSGTVASTTTVNLEADTNRNATLKFDTSDVAYGSMGTTFGSTGGTDDHLHTLTGLTAGAYTYYVRAADSTSSYVISFSIDPDSTNLITINTITDYTADTLAGYEYHNICDTSTEVGPNNTSGVQAQAYYVEADLGAEHDITESSLFGDTLNNWTCNTWQFRWKQAPGDSWTEAWAAEDCNKNDWDLHQSLSISNARYVRMDAVSATVGTEIREWRVFGTLSSQGEATGTGGAGRHFTGAVEGQYFEDAVYGR
jgi:hypothetical protein